MTRTGMVAISLCTAMAVQGCSLVNEALWPDDRSETTTASSRGTPPAPPTAPAVLAPPASPTEPAVLAPPAPPQLGSTNFVPPTVTPGQPTGTFVGQKVGQVRKELGRLQASLRQQNGVLQQVRDQTLNNSTQYHTTIAAINARLQVGTTPGNPTLITQWDTAQTLLAAIDNDIADLNSLANDVSNTSTLSAYMLETTRATYGLTGAVDEDHRQLAVLEDEVNRTVVLIDRLLNELSVDVNRQTIYLARERANLTTLSLAIKNGELLGSSLSNRAFWTAAPAASPVASGPPPRRPLVVIRFDRPNVEYEQALYTAVSRALERRPAASFDLVAVAPNRGSPAEVTVATNISKRNAESVLRALSDMGMPLDRVRLSAVTSGEAASNEVHIYVR